MTEHVVIAGGGIAGSAAALALRRAGVAVTVLEARPVVGGGAVVRVNPNGMDALRAVGAHQAVIETSFPLLRFEWYSPTGRMGYRLTSDPSAERGMPRVMAWVDLARVLQEQAARAGAVFRYDARVIESKETAAGATALLADGETVEGDVIVGADGVRSSVRACIDPDAPAPSFMKRRTVYGFTPEPAFEPPPPEVLRAYMDRGFLAATRDSLTGGCYWFTSLPATEPLASGEGTDLELWRGRLVDVFGADSVPATPAVRDADRILAFDDYTLPHLPHWHSDRMVVLGDAAHVTTPGSEQGAAMAIEDGVVLAQCLRDNAEPAAALGRFEQQRRRRAEAVVTLGMEEPQPPHAAARLGRWARDRIRDVRRRKVLDTGGNWALDHHIDWNQRHD